MRKLALACITVAAIGCGNPTTHDVTDGSDALHGFVSRWWAPYDRVLLLSVDGLHALDLERFVAAHPDSALARLAASGTTYAEAHGSAPSDSFPGLTAMLTGGSPAVTGVYYDDSYDRRLSPPGSSCDTRGTEVVYDETIDVNPDALDAGGGIDPAKLPRDPDRGCAPVYPHEFLRVNTVFEVVRDFGGRTAWSDKHPAYDLVNGPSGHGVDELYTPEINANGITDQVSTTETYDDGKVQAVLSWIAGRDHTGKKARVPTVFGMNFQAVSVGQKTVGYVDTEGTPSAGLADALAHTDASIGRMLDALDATGRADRTLVIVGAKHGQSAIDPAARTIVDSKRLAAAINAVQAGLLAQLTADDAGLVWLTDASKTDAVVAALETQRDALAIDHIYAGAAIDLLFDHAANDTRTPDLFIQPRSGVIYTKPSATKLAEHGGLSEDDRHVALIVSSPSLAPSMVRAPVGIAQIAPTILRALGLPTELLAAVDAESTPALPDLF
jgi:predicted AlkP superfamily pyrophosphatase or phosphodiesterase